MSKTRWLVIASVFLAAAVGARATDARRADRTSVAVAASRLFAEDTAAPQPGAARTLVFRLTQRIAEELQRLRPTSS